MGLLKRLTSLFTPAPAALSRQVYPLRVECGRCGEIIEAPVDLRNDLSIEYDEKTGAAEYVCRKVLIGQARCFQRVEVMLRFNPARKLVDQETTGGKFLPAEP
jgi:hypothetical protein